MPALEFSHGRLGEMLSLNLTAWNRNLLQNYFIVAALLSVCVASRLELREAALWFPRRVDRSRAAQFCGSTYECNRPSLLRVIVT